MKTIHRAAANSPISQQVLAEAIDVIYKAIAMGLTKKPINIFKLDFSGIKTYLKEIAKTGIGERVLADVDRWDTNHPEELLGKLRTLNEVLEESPNPRMEWEMVRRYLPDDLLCHLVGISESSIQRYSSGERETPSQVCGRLHILALIIGDLIGTYNYEGVKQWFTRPRKHAFAGSTPVELLTGEWQPHDPNPTKVRDFAHSLHHFIAT